jgi:hypothetical protein
MYKPLAFYSSRGKSSYEFPLCRVQSLQAIPSISAGRLSTLSPSVSIEITPSIVPAMVDKAYPSPFVNSLTIEDEQKGAKSSSIYPQRQERPSVDNGV